MIKQIHFENFKALRDVTVDLARFTLIVGPNASGKTSILEGIQFVSQLATKAPADVFCGSHAVSQLKSRGATGEMQLRLDGEWCGKQARLTVSASDPPSLFGAHTLHVVSRDFQIEGSAFGFAHGGPFPLPAPVRDAVGSAVLLHLDPHRLGEASYSADPTPHVEFDGRNLAATLADLAITRPFEFQTVCARLRVVVPSVRSVGFERVPRPKDVAYRVKLDFAGADGVPGHAVSEGTLISLGLLTLLSSQPMPQLVMIDELERGLHPKALGELAGQIRVIMGEFPELQVIGTSHSPYLVDHFQADEIRLTTSQDDGSVLVGSLNEHPDFERWKDEMKPGEFWSTVGEDWLRERKEPKGA